MRAVVRSKLEAANWVSFKSNMVDGRPYEIQVKPFKRKRTLDQNAKMHVMMRELAAHIGYSDSEFKDFVKLEYGPKQVSRIGDKDYLLPKSTRDYNVAECGEIIEILYMLAAECGHSFQETENAPSDHGGRP
jgi:hypothetical protein